MKYILSREQLDAIVLEEARNVLLERKISEVGFVGGAGSIGSLTPGGDPVQRLFSWIAKKTGQAALAGASTLAPPAVEELKEFFAETVIEHFGFDPNGLMAQVVINFVGNFGLEEMGELISGGGVCLTLANEIIEATEEPFVEGLPSYLGYERGGVFGNYVEELIANAVVRDRGLNKFIADRICSLFGLGSGGVSAPAAAAGVTGGKPGATGTKSSSMADFFKIVKEDNI